MQPTVTLDQYRELQGLARLVGGGPNREWALQFLGTRHKTPVIPWGRSTYQIRDQETFENGTLYYAMNARHPGQSGAWGLFFEEARLVSSGGWEQPFPLDPDQVRKELLEPYRHLTLSRENLTFPKLKIEEARFLRPTLAEQYLTLQNNHRIRLLWDPTHLGPQETRLRNGSIRWLWYPTLPEVIAGLSQIPLGALSLVHEVWIRPRYHPELEGQSYFRNGRRILILYPQDETDDTELARQISKRQKPQARRRLQLHYTIFHEGFGHPLVRNKFVRREMAKIIASGEPPPSSYANTSDEEWLADGVSERWFHEIFYEPAAQREWDERHPYLMGLISHLLEVLEGRVEPLNDNIANWKGNAPSHTLILS